MALAVLQLKAIFSSKARRRYNAAVLSRCEEGDMLEFERVGYHHWAVYVGNQRVIHRTEHNGTVGVREDWFWDVVGNDMVKIDNYFDITQAALPGWQIVERARSKLGKEGYNVLFRNCEHFATWCRYGVRFSKQSFTVATASASLTAAGVATANPIIAGVGLAIGALAAVTSMGSKLSL